MSEPSLLTYKMDEGPDKNSSLPSSDILYCVRNSYLTQAVTRALFIGCIGTHAHDRQVTSLLNQSDIIM